MACPTCTETKPVAKCVTLLGIGAIALDLTDVYIYIKNLTTGRIQRVPATSDISGALELDLTNPDKEFYAPGFTFELWVTLRTADQNDKLDVTIGYTTADCYTVRFEEIFAGEDLAVFAEQDLEVDV